MQWHAIEPEDKIIDFYNKASAISFLQGFLHAPLNMNTMRHILKDSFSRSNLPRLNNYEIIDQIAWQLTTGQLRIVKLHQTIPTWDYQRYNIKELEILESSPFITAEESHWIEYQFIDSAGKPLSGIPYEYTGLDNRMERGTLPNNGVIRKENYPVTGECNVRLFILTNAQWSEDSARVGDVVKLMADGEGFKDGTKAVFEIWESDIDGKDDFITKIKSSIKGGKIETEWKYEYREDKDDVTKEDEQKGYSAPEYYFWVKVKECKARSDLLRFRDWIEIELKDEENNPIADEDFLLFLANGEVKKGKTDQNGYIKVEDICPGSCHIKFPNI